MKRAIAALAGVAALTFSAGAALADMQPIPNPPEHHHGMGGHHHGHHHHHHGHHHHHHH